MVIVHAIMAAKGNHALFGGILWQPKNKFRQL